MHLSALVFTMSYRPNPAFPAVSQNRAQSSVHQSREHWDTKKKEPIGPMSSLASHWSFPHIETQAGPCTSAEGREPPWQLQCRPRNLTTSPSPRPILWLPLLTLKDTSINVSDPKTNKFKGIQKRRQSPADIPHQQVSSQNQEAVPPDLCQTAVPRPRAGAGHPPVHPVHSTVARRPASPFPNLPLDAALLLYP